MTIYSKASFRTHCRDPEFVSISAHNFESCLFFQNPRSLVLWTCFRPGAKGAQKLSVSELGIPNCQTWVEMRLEWTIWGSSTVKMIVRVPGAFLDHSRALKPSTNMKKCYKSIVKTTHKFSFNPKKIHLSRGSYCTCATLDKQNRLRRALAVDSVQP